MNISGKGVKRRGRRPVGIPQDRQALYAYLRAKYPNMPQTEAKALVGYAPNTVPSPVPKFTFDLEKARERAIESTGYTIENALKILFEEIAKDKGALNADRIRAIATANNMLPGYNAPTEIKQSNKTLIMEFQGITNDKLSEFISIASKYNENE